MEAKWGLSLLSGSRDSIKASNHQKSSRNEKVKSGCPSFKVYIDSFTFISFVFQSDIFCGHYLVLNFKFPKMTLWVNIVCSVVSYVIFGENKQKFGQDKMDISNSI